MTQAEATVLEQIDQLLEEHDPSRQDVLIAMSQGRLSRDEVRAFASQYYHLMDALPRFVSTVHAVTIAHPEIRRSLLNILVPLELHPPSVADLWLQTCAALGLFSDTVRSGEPTASTVACLSDFDYLCHEGTIQGLAALYAWFTRLPRVCRVEQAALAAHYDLAAGPGVHFFEVVGFQAESHARALRTALEQMVRQYPEAGPAAFHSAEAAIVAVEGMWRGALELART